MLEKPIIHLQRKFNHLRCRLISKRQELPVGALKNGYLTIYHDYEGKYAFAHVGDYSLRGVTFILDAEKAFNLKATYNIVGKLIIEYPEIVDRVVAEGHELASHSYDHKVMSDLSFNEVRTDISKTKENFKSKGLDLYGFRSPQNRWTFQQMRAMLKEGLFWSAEIDKAKNPYVLLQENENKLIRMPIVMDDWGYISKKIQPDMMLKSLLDAVDHIVNERSYGAFGFHPWIQGAEPERLLTLKKFLEIISKKEGLKIVTFGEMYSILLKNKIL